jgi:hypothetical protein
LVIHGILRRETTHFRSSVVHKGKLGGKNNENWQALGQLFKHVKIIILARCLNCFEHI